MPVTRSRRAAAAAALQSPPPPPLQSPPTPPSIKRSRSSPIIKAEPMAGGAAVAMPTATATPTAPRSRVPLTGVPDHLADGLDILICGINPGIRSATEGRHFAHPTNHFYPALHAAGLTPRRVAPVDDETLLWQRAPFPRIGLTNLCRRPTVQASELVADDYSRGTPMLHAKLARYRPRVCCFVGKGIAHAFEAIAVPAEPAKRRRTAAAAATTPTALATGETERKRQAALTIRVPASLPWRDDASDGVGLLPYLIQHAAPPATPGGATPIKTEPTATRRRCSPYFAARTAPAPPIKREPVSEPAVVDVPVDMHADPSSPSPPLLPSLPPLVTFFWSTPSTSARVTHFRLADKAAALAQLRAFVDWLRGPGADAALARGILDADPRDVKPDVKQDASDGVANDHRADDDGLVARTFRLVPSPG
ncbi:hypothetical protein CXG81DRAFT_24554 [Caulochytrium protostelioides]|uniref:Uracil-DNA glycosylase-like domain-containing protein n=1 Tax=Caulochytrium protostelioides TaxID=1555241 RepID=A0A4P9XBJ9_9FUNG|nr:hypothetical protein CXG81DRAFT_24554 [Caulochytrium protostelioides]|eukprot:RKP02766.1 hypothetical protein CXG81DRAFT_24554 [Caulochytrium protostelioides]